MIVYSGSHPENRYLAKKVTLFTFLLVLMGGIHLVSCSDEVSIPVASIEAPPTAAVGERIELNGSRSWDPEGGTLRFDWSLSVPEGSQAELDNPHLMAPVFVADVAGTYTVQLVVSNSDAHSAPATAVIEVAPIANCGANPPEIDAITIEPEYPNAGAWVSLSAIISDADSDPDLCDLPETFTYQWWFIRIPRGSQADLTNASSLSCDFRTDVPGEYELGLRVTDSTGLIDEETVTVTASQCGLNPPVITSLTSNPVTPDTGEQVSLSAMVSDADMNLECGLSEHFEYYWWFVSLPAGSQAVLNSNSVMSPSFVADVPGDFLVGLRVTDSTGQVDQDTFAIAVGECGSHSPAITDMVSDPQSPYIGSLVTLSATVSDHDSAPLCGLSESFVYRWWFISLPPGSLAALNNPSIVSPSFLADVPGDYLVGLRVTDSAGHSNEATLVVTVSDCGIHAPVIIDLTALPESPNTGDRVTLEAIVSDADMDPDCSFAESLSYHWWFVGLPSSSQATMDDATTSAASFVADVPGDFTVGVRVTDATERTDEETLVVEVSECGSHPPVIANLTATPEQPNVSDEVNLSATVSDADTDPSCGLSESFDYHWWFIALPTDSEAVFNGAQTMSPTFTPDVTGDFVVGLQVTDSTGRTDEDSLTVTTSNCGNYAPIAQIEVLSPTQAGPASEFSEPVGVPTGVLVELDGSASYDPDTVLCDLEQNLTYQWWFYSIPPTSHAALNGSTLVNPSFTPDVYGVYQIVLRVSDSTHEDLAHLDVYIDPAQDLDVAAGFAVSLVVDGDEYWDGPEGLTLDEDGNIYVVQNGGSMVTRTDPNTGETEPFATWPIEGGEPEQAIHDIAWYHGREEPPVEAAFFVTNEANGVIRLDGEGQPERWSENVAYAGGGIVHYEANLLEVEIDSMILVDFARSEQPGCICNLALSGPVYCGSLEAWSDPGPLQNPWGIGVSATDSGMGYPVINMFYTYFFDEVYGNVVRVRNEPRGEETQQFYIEHLTEPEDLPAEERLIEPRDIATVRDNPALAILVADSGSGRVAAVENCAAVELPCEILTLVSDLVEPYGLAFEAPDTLLLTDRATNRLFRLEGDFESLF